jgi:2-hydroxychromene-2-carboxylate isomerase
VIDIDFFYDPISPYAHLAFQALPEALRGHAVTVRYRPVLFAGLLKAHGQLGPAEIAPKRDWTYRQVQWLGHAHGIRLDLPAAHPFNPLPLLRLGLATAHPDEPLATSRWVTAQLFEHVWHGGADAADPGRLAALEARLRDHVREAGRDWPAADAVKAGLRENGEAALRLGLFGVPAMVVQGRVFWGFDALPMLAAWLAGDAWFQGGAWEQAAALPVGVSRVG